MKKIMIICIFILCVFPLISAEKKMRLAVIDFVPNNVTKYLARAVSENINTELAKKSQYFDVIERSRIKSIVAEQGLQMTGITDSKSAVKMGKLLSAKKILVGTVSKIGNVFTMTVRVIDVETGRVKFAESERCTKVDDIDDASRYLAFKLINRITGENFKLPKRDYSREEGRNKFAIGFSTNASMNISKGYYPSIILPANTSEAIDQVDVATIDKIEGVGISLSLIMSYEFTRLFSLRMEFGYVFLAPDHYKDIMKDYGGATDIYSSSGFDYSHSGKIDVFGQFNLKLDGFIPYAAVGIGYQFLFSNAYVHRGGINVIDGETQSYNINSSNFNILNITPEIGCAIYLSKYVEILISFGIIIPVYNDIFENLKLVKMNEGVTVDTVGWRDLDSKLDFNGLNYKIPIQMYVRLGVLFRLF